MEFFLTPSLTAGLVYLAGLAIAIGYLLFLPEKTRDSKLILALMLGWFANAFVVIFYQVTHTHLLIAGPGFDNAPLLTYVYGTSQLFFQVCLVILLFRIGFPFSRWEEKILVAIIALFIVYSTIIYALSLGDADTLINHTRLTTQVPDRQRSDHEQQHDRQQQPPARCQRPPGDRFRQVDVAQRNAVGIGG